MFPFSDLLMPEQPAAPELNLSQALQTWVEISGVDPCSRCFTLGELSVCELHSALKEALELDDTEITGLLLFDYVVTIYMQDRTFNVDDLLERPDMVASYLAKCRELRAFLRSDRLKQIGDDFSGRVLQAVESYGAASNDTRTMIADRHTIAVLRRDALRTIKMLEVHQFLDGRPEDTHVRPVYGKFVYQWANVNSMLNAMTTMPSGVTVNLIRHPTEPLQSYFVFAIRNGGKIFMFTDREAEAHPLQAQMIRRPDRVLAARSQRHWFPYQLLGYKVNDQGDIYFPPIDGRSLVRYQKVALPIAPIAELESQQVIWIAMMLDLIVDKFWLQGYRAPALSYTGEMIKIATPLLDAAKAANLPVPVYQKLDLRPLTVADVRSGAIQEKDVGKFGHGKNLWLEQRYAHLVKDDILNLVAAPDVKLIQPMDHQGQLGEVVALEDKKERNLFMSELDELNKRRVHLEVMPASAFGTAECLEADRKFLARANFAENINRFAWQEYERRKDEIISWVRARVTANKENLLPMFLEKEVWVTSPKRDTFDDGASGRYDSATGQRQFMERVPIAGDEGKNRRDYLYTEYTNGSLWFHSGNRGRKYLCFETSAPAYWLVKFVPETTEHLAMLCGCSIAELPDVLQHWTQLAKYVGNSILSRIDPMEWKVKNPWNELPFTLLYFVSVSGLKAIEKRLGAKSKERTALQRNINSAGKD